MKKSKILLIAAIIGTIMVILIFYSMKANIDENTLEDGTNDFGHVLGSLIVAPSAIASALATIFAWVGFGTNNRNFALASGILYAVAIVLMIPWFMLNIVQMVLCFIAYSYMGKNKNGKTETTV